MEYKKILNDKNVDNRWLNRYFKMIDYFEAYEGEGEKHHILPKSIFPQFIKNAENILKVSYKGHFIIHYILSKVFLSNNEKRKMIFAFNQMRRISKNNILYEYNRKNISKAISENNRNRIIISNETTQTQKTIKNFLSIPDGFKKGLLVKNKEKRKLFHSKNIIVKNSEGYIFPVSRTNENFLKGNLFHYNKGSVKSMTTKEKISNNGIKNRKSYTNGEKVIFLKEGEVVPTGYVLGNCFSKQNCVLNKNKFWFHNKETGKNIRLKKEDKVPKGYVKNRLKFNNVGSTGMSWYTNFKENKMFLRGEQPSNWFKGLKNQKLFKLFNKEELVGHFSYAEIISKFNSSLLKTNKEKYIGHNIKYISRLSQDSKKYIGYYLEETTKEEFITSRNNKI